MISRGFVQVLAFVAFLALALPPHRAHGQSSTEHQEIASIRAYAPIVWLANGEPFYPSLPHPYAFDGVDNDYDGRVDLDDPDEISEALRWPNWRDRLSDFAASFRDRERAPEPRILYKVVPVELDNEPQPLDTIQMWLYYVADVGTGSHPGDSEHAFIFINRDVTRSRDVSRRVTFGSVRAIVGAGHTPDTANNILATGSMQSPTGVMPAKLPKHMPLLVELGKHATAPDLTMDGRFNRGIDSNVFRQAAWGSRDGFGFDVLEFLSGYREEFSLPRNLRDVMLERDALASPESVRQYQEDFPVQFADPGHFSAHRRYRFLPLDEIQHIFTILEMSHAINKDNRITPEKRREKLDGHRKALEAHLEKHKECFWPVGKAPKRFTLGDHQFAAFVHWVEVSDKHTRVWKQRDFTEPKDIFKTYLYPRIELGVSRMWTQDEPAGQLIGAMVRVAEFSVGSKPFMNDSSLEFYTNFQTQPRALYDWGLTYRYFRGGFGGPYFGLGWRGERRRGTADLSIEEKEGLMRNFGDAVENVPPRFERHTGIDLGYAISVNVSRFPTTRRLRRVTLGGMFGVRSELFAENLSPVEEALNPNLPRRTRFQAKFTVHVGVLGPRHPLQR